MKKILIAILLLAGSFGYANAQTTKPKTIRKKPSASAIVTSHPKTKKVEKSTSTMHMKANGTPDKRYKENKVTAKATTVPMKKNGTPDMRYKANKKK